MKKIPFTAEHRAKVIEMCDHYQPELRVKGAIFTDRILLYKFGHPMDNIHWLEFCLTYLAKEIIFRKDNPNHFAEDTYVRLANNIIRTFENNDKQIHPVDFLHTEFLKRNK
jgi:hypothetical protein